MVDNCMMNAKELIKHDGLKCSPWNNLSIEAILVALVVDSKGKNDAASIVQEIDFLIHDNDFLKECNKFEKYLKGNKQML